MMIPKLESILILSGRQKYVKEPEEMAVHIYLIKKFGRVLMTYKLDIQNWRNNGIQQKMGN